MTEVTPVQRDLIYLTENIKTPPSELGALHSTFVHALIKLGHNLETAEAAVDAFVHRTVH